MINHTPAVSGQPAVKKFVSSPFRLVKARCTRWPHSGHSSESLRREAPHRPQTSRLKAVVGLEREEGEPGTLGMNKIVGIPQCGHWIVSPTCSESNSKCPKQILQVHRVQVPDGPPTLLISQYSHAREPLSSTNRSADALIRLPKGQFSTPVSRLSFRGKATQKLIECPVSSHRPKLN